MKKILGLMAIVALLVLAFVPLASAGAVTVASHTGANYASPTSATIRNVYPSGFLCAQGQAFNASQTGYVYSITIPMKIYSGAPDCVLYCALVGLQGTYGVSEFPASPVLETSAGFHASGATLSASFNDVTFTFGGITQLTQYSTYGFYIFAGSAVTLDSSNSVIPQFTQAAYDGSRMTFSSSVWSNPSYDMIFSVDGNTVSSGVTPTPTPAPSATPEGQDGGDVAMQGLTDALLPILVPLLVVLIPAFLGLKFVGAWGFMAGLNVGVIIAYVTLSTTAYSFPLWGVVFVGIVDVLLVMKARG